MLISSITPLIESYGLVFVAVLICLKVSLCRFRAKRCLSSLQFSPALAHHQLHIIAIVLTAAAAAFVGQLIGYMIGRQFGYRLLLQYGGYLRITEGRIKLGRVSFSALRDRNRDCRSLCTVSAKRHRHPRRSQPHACAAFLIRQRCRCPSVDISSWVPILSVWKSDPSGRSLDRYCCGRSRCDRHRCGGQLPAAARRATYSGS